MENQVITKIDVFYLDVKPFIESDIYTFKSLISNNATLSSLISFNSCGEIEFDSDKHETWIINLVDEFKRKHINAIVFNVDDTNIKYNPQQYKYLILFQNITKALNSYGYIWVKEDKSLVRFALDYAYEEIIHHLIKDLNFWKVEKLYNAIYQEPKISLKEFNNVYKEYIETYRWNDFEEWENLSKKKI